MRLIKTGCLVILSLFVIAVSVTACAAKQDSHPESAEEQTLGRDALAKLRAGHPRLMMTPDTIATLKAALPGDPWLQKRYARQKKRADDFLTEPVSVYKVNGRDGIVDVSRQVFERVATLALVYRMEGDKKYLDRAWQELDAANHFPDWGPRQFLDTAELTAAFSVAYDWLYDGWTPAQRATIRQAIIDRGLKPGLAAYASQNWPHDVDNHNTVNNGGLIMGALAVGDESPDLARQILGRALVSDRKSLSQFGPDGAWPEGPMYWFYATLYESMSLDSLETATGSDFGLGDIPGMDKGGWFPLYDNGPADGTFNYGDADEDHEVVTGPQLLWMTQRYKDPRFAQYERDAPHGRLSALELVWGADTAHQPWQTIEPDRYFRGVELATMRDGWDKPNGWFVGFKAGSNNIGHAHLDVGSFVLEAKGVRWAVDLGPDDSNHLPGYSHDDGDQQRWTYYRLRAEAHNTLVINPGMAADQEHTGAGKITAFNSTPQGVNLTADLTGVYPAARQVTRSLSFARGQSVTVDDTLHLKQPGDIWWFLQTRAAIKPSADGRELTLSQNGKTLTLKLLQPAATRFETGPSQPLPGSPNPPNQAANTGVSRISIHLAKVQDAAISVRFEN
jgi:hypothetical protein